MVAFAVVTGLLTTEKPSPTASVDASELRGDTCAKALARALATAVTIVVTVLLARENADPPLVTADALCKEIAVVAI